MRILSRFVREAGLLLSLFIAVCSAEAVPAESTTPKTSFNFIPQWIPQAQFAGFYVAREAGIYAAHDLQVTILDGGPHNPPSKLLADGRADCGTFFLADAVRRSEAGLALINVAQLVQRSSLMLIARKSSGIASPGDLDGRKVSLWGDEFELQPLALFRKFGIKPKIVPQSVTLNLFLRGGVDAASAMWHNEYHTVLNSGFDPEELTVFFYHQYGLNFPEDGLYCREDLWRSNRSEVCRFAAATLEGWRRAFANPEEALDIIMRHADAAQTGTNRVHQRWMLERMRDVMLPQGEGFGKLDAEDYYRVTAALKAAGLSKQTPVLDDFYGKCP